MISKKFLKVVLIGMILQLGLVSKLVLAEEISPHVLREYLSQMIPTEADQKKCSTDTSTLACLSTVNAVSKLNLNLRFQFVVNPFSNAVTEALPPEVVSRMQLNRESFHSFDRIINSSPSSLGNTVTVTDTGPASGGSNAQRVVLGQLLELGLGNSLPQKNISYIGANDSWENTGSSSTPATPGGITLPDPDGQEGGQSGVNPQGGQTSPGAQGGQTTTSQPVRPYGVTGLTQSVWDGLTKEQQEDIYQFFLNQAVRSGIETGGAVERQGGDPDRRGAIRFPYSPFQRTPRNNNLDQDANNPLPFTTPQRDAEIRNVIQSRLGGKRPGATDPAYRKIGDQEGPVVKRPLTKEEQNKLNQSIGQGGFNRTRDVWAGANAQKVAPSVVNNPRPAPVETCVGLECNQ